MKNLRARIHSRRRYPGSPQAGSGGFTLIGLLMIVALMGIALLAVGEVWHVAQKREKEQALLFVGNQFRQAIKAYYSHAPIANKQQPYPLQLEDLLKDPRYPSTRRYLRKIYIDPMTGLGEWGVLRLPNGGIYGIYSLSGESPIKRSNFRPIDIGFEGKDKYSDWKFVYLKSQNQK
jgi:type II secretory pathway pseudopilin PulG